MPHNGIILPRKSTLAYDNQILRPTPAPLDALPPSKTDETQRRFVLAPMTIVPGVRSTQRHKKAGLPDRFQHPETWHYPHRKVPEGPAELYMTTSHAYGRYAPTKSEMPEQFHGVSQQFSDLLSRAGPYRNCSLNIK